MSARGTIVFDDGDLEEIDSLSLTSITRELEAQPDDEAAAEAAASDDPGTERVENHHFDATICGLLDDLDGSGEDGPADPAENPDSGDGGDLLDADLLFSEQSGAKDTD